MRTWSLAVWMLSVVTFVSGCGGAAAPKVTPRVDVAGTVSLDGQPMDGIDATITFSVGGGEAPAILPIKGGKFEGKAPVGDARVEIRAMRQGEPVMMGDKPVEGSGKYNFVAEEFNDKSTLTAKIPAAGAKDLKFEVKAKPEAPKGT